MFSSSKVPIAGPKFILEFLYYMYFKGAVYLLLSSSIVALLVIFILHAC